MTGGCSCMGPYSDSCTGECEGVHACGHRHMVAGCGGCDPGAIEFVVLDGEQAVRPYDPDRDLAKPYNGDPWARSNPNPIGDTRPPLRPSKPKQSGVRRRNLTNVEKKLRRHGG